jgi:hypothetical protein
MKFRGTNFLDALHPERAKKRRAFLFVRIIFYFFATVLAASLIFSAIYFWTIRDVYNLADSGKKNLELAVGRAESLDFTNTNLYLSEAKSDFLAAQVRFGSLGFLKLVPWAADQYGAIENLIETGIETTSALQEVVGVFGDIVNVAGEAESTLGGVPAISKETSFSDLTPERKREILQKLFESVPRLTAAKLKIGQALSSLDEIKEERVVGQIFQVVKMVRETLLKLQTAVDKAIPAAEILPQLAGYPEEKTYLFLLQNSDEMRPTGGFIGTYGIVKVRDGEVKTFETENIYTLDGPATNFLKIEPPPPIKKYLKVGAWFMRDSNWSPDFPTAAAKAEWFYHAERGVEKKIDAVVAITPVFMENILRLVGNIEMDGTTFTPENLMEVLQYKVEKEYYEKGIPEWRRKDIVGQLGDKIFERLANLPSSSWPGLMDVAEKALAERHFLVWSKVPELEAIIAREGWDGAVRNAETDYLMVVDANLASLKTDGVMEKKINYSFALGGDGKLHAKVEMVYKNKGTFTWKTTRYRTYTRIYVPAGSTLVRGTGMMENDKISDPARRPGKVDVGEELGKTYFGAFISIEPGEERTLSFEYILPDKIKSEIDQGLYKLIVQKQAGTAGHPLTLNLDFGKNIKQAVPAEESKEWGNNTYKLQTDLRIDKELEIKF